MIMAFKLWLTEAKIVVTVDKRWKISCRSLMGCKLRTLALNV